MKRGAEMIDPLKKWFFALSKRERIMVGGAAILAPAYLLIALLIMPVIDEYRMLDQRLQNQQRNNTELAQQISTLGTALQDSPNSRQRREIELLEQELYELRAEVGMHLDALVAPEQMPTILRRLLQHQPGLTLRSIENAPAQIIRTRQDAAMEGEEHAGSDPDTGGREQKEEVEHLYRQPLIIELEGPYLDALAYMDKIRTWPEHMFIDSIDISMEEYPRNEIILQVSSISTAASLLRGKRRSGEAL